jgi:hypothetical protein
MFDNIEEISYNEDNDSYEIVKMDEQRPINDTTCQHETLIADPEDTIGNAIFHSCSNPKCGIGFYINSK